ncbi:hypothetical protein AU184_22730 [Mycolicibacterium novocastrense]|nr:hypothetical protein AU072_24800 [Mycolicibacterium novocastrense]KUH68320.1 hypothetical protein AU184_22730 [Mycolicibacterium novocastrense]KUH73399.1 hypothetical protein AU183_23620 [Mycolicibacterium novocastrense]
MCGEFGKPQGQFAHEVVPKANEINLLNGSSDCERRPLLDPRALVNSAKCNWFVQLLILRLD